MKTRQRLNEKRVSRAAKTAEQQALLLLLLDDGALIVRLGLALARVRFGRLYLDFRTELDDAVRRDVEVVAGGARITRHGRKQPFAPKRPGSPAPRKDRRAAP